MNGVILNLSYLSLQKQDFHIFMFLFQILLLCQFFVLLMFCVFRFSMFCFCFGKPGSF